MTEIIDYLDKLFPNPKCELEYTKDYELLIAVMLSAQTTDKRVNMVTDILFKKYDSLEKLASADINDIIEIIKPIGTFNKKFPKNKLNRLHHQLVLFGRYYCKAKNPNCVNCKLKEICKEKGKI